MADQNYIPKTFLSDEDWKEFKHDIFGVHGDKGYLLGVADMLPEIESITESSKNFNQLKSELLRMVEERRNFLKQNKFVEMR